MLKPVAPGEFFSSPAGVEYGRLFPDNLSTEADCLMVARWQTANYDPETGFCTLYRGVDEDRKNDALRAGAITSRVVEAFGMGDVYVASEALESVAQGGGVPDWTLTYAQPLIEMSARNIADLSRGEYHWLADDARSEHDEAVAVLEGRLSDRILREMLETAGWLRTAAHLGESAFRLAALRACSDDVPTRAGFFSVDCLLGSSIFCTADPNLFNANLGKMGYDAVLRVDFKPGSLAAAPEAAYLDGEGYITRGLEDYGFSDEAEWYVIGNVVAGENVKISLQETL